MIGPLILLDIMFGALRKLWRYAVDLRTEFRHHPADLTSDEVLFVYAESVQQIALQLFRLILVYVELGDQTVGFGAAFGLLQPIFEVLDAPVNCLLFANQSRDPPSGC